MKRKSELWAPMPNPRLTSVLSAIAIGFAGSVQSALAAPITINTALPISEDELILREQIVFINAGNEIIDRQQINALSIAGFGVNSSLSVFGVVPVTHIETVTAGQSSRLTGLGDVMVFARHEIYAKDGIGKTTRIAPFAGVRLPTGRDGITDHSMDVFGGLIFTQATLDYNLGAQLSFDHSGTGRGFNRGDRAEFATTFQYRLHPQELSGQTQGFVFGVFETQLAISGDNRLDDIVMNDTGGVQLSFTPGLQYAAKRWIADVAVTVPVVDSREGPGPKMDYAVSAGWRVNF